MLWVFPSAKSGVSDKSAKFHTMPSEQFSISVPLNAGEATKTNIMGTRLQDETGTDFRRVTVIPNGGAAGTA